MNPLVASVIRTLVPVAVGQVSSWLLLVNVVLSPDAKTGLGAFLGGLITAIYYVGVRIIEQQWPSFGVLLGLPKSPDTYSTVAPSIVAEAKQAAPAAPVAPVVPELAPATVFPAAKVEAAIAPVEPVAVTPVFEAPAEAAAPVV